MKLTYQDILDSIDRILLDDDTLQNIKGNITKRIGCHAVSKVNESHRRLEKRGFIKIVYVGTDVVYKPYYKVYVLK
jgi:hypothetical protein